LAAPGLIAHFVTPAAVVRQQVTKPGLPHVDFAAQWTTAPTQACGKLRLWTASFATPVTQRTYCPWVAAVPHGHCAAAKARVAATAFASEHAACAAVDEKSKTTTPVRKRSIVIVLYRESRWNDREVTGDDRPAWPRPLAHGTARLLTSRTSAARVRPSDEREGEFERRLAYGCLTSVQPEYDP
jgi:hypothetical protein